MTSSFITPIAVEDWDVLEHVMDYSYAKQLHCTSTEHPVMMSEASVSFLCSLNNYNNVDVVLKLLSNETNYYIIIVMGKPQYLVDNNNNNL